MTTAAARKIPYGLMDYERIIRENYYYIDKTAFIHDIEKAGEYIFFIRPRRFGKTLLLSMLETYYDISKKDDFDIFFKGTDILTNPTGEQNSYLMLKFNFSMVAPHPSVLEDSFHGHVFEAADLFLSQYASVLNIDGKETAEELKNKKTPVDILRFIIHLCRKKQRKLYIIIDEYDNFSNTILVSRGSREYEDLTHGTHGDSFFKAFFSVLKGGASGSGAPISRLFITGVSPVTMDDVTSGFNIGINISIQPEFNRMLGFTTADVTAMIEYYRDAGLVKHDTAFLLDFMNRWYNNYAFSRHFDSRLFNSDMVLYFMVKYLGRGELPDNPVDRNVRIDYSKLRHLIILDREDYKGTNGNFNRLKQILRDHRIPADLVEGFPLEKITDNRNFLSLLFYFGLLTVKGIEEDELILEIPNETAKRLYYDYISEAYEETGVFAMDLYHFNRLMHAMAYKGQWRELFDYITGLMSQSMALRDLITGEKSIHAFLNVYLGLSNLYIIHREKELNMGFADLVLEPFKARYEGIKYSYLVEVKYLKKGSGANKKALSGEVRRLAAEGEEQLKRYALDKRFAGTIAGTTLIRLVAVFCGNRLEHLAEVSEVMELPRQKGKRK